MEGAYRTLHTEASPLPTHTKVAAAGLSNSSCTLRMTPPGASTLTATASLCPAKGNPCTVTSRLGVACPAASAFPTLPISKVLKRLSPALKMLLPN